MASKNLNGLTIRQHVFPRASIARFTNQRGQVALHYKEGNACLVSSKHKVFCALQVWDDWSEHGRANPIEEEYQRVASSFANRVGDLTSSESKVLTQMFCLWVARCWLRHSPATNYKLNGVTGETYPFTQDQREKAEKMGVVTLGSDGTLPSRLIVGDQIQLGMASFCGEFGNTNWTCVEYRGETVLVPDGFYRFPYMPLSPSKAFISNSHQHLSISELNSIALSESVAYYFSAPG